jgi:alkylated DNA nucleotide flippase Atl1
MAFTSRIPFRQKVNRIQSKIVTIPLRMQKQYGKGTMLIPRALDMEELIRNTPKGKLITHDQIRQRLASCSGAQVTCPMTTGIFLRLIAEAAEEERKQGKAHTPYWRVIKGDGLLNPKFPGGIAGQAKLLKAEGHTVHVIKKDKARVENFESKLTGL